MNERKESPSGMVDRDNDKQRKKIQNGEDRETYSKKTCATQNGEQFR